MKTKLLYFSSTWCTPCQYIKKFINEVSEETGIEIEHVDVDKDMSSKVQAAFNSAIIKSVPTFVLVEETRTKYEIINIHRGIITKQNLIKFVKNVK